MKTSSIYRGHCFPPAIISLAVRWYFRFSLSLRDIEELLFERDVIVSYESIRRWCDKFGARFAAHVKITGRIAKTWHLDEMFVRLRGEPYWLWRAVDEQGQELNIPLQKCRDTAAAEQFFKRILRNHPASQVIVTDQLRSYPAAKARSTKQIFVRAAARVNIVSQSRERSPTSNTGIMTTRTTNEEGTTKERLRLGRVLKSGHLIFGSEEQVLHVVHDGTASLRFAFAFAMGLCVRASRRPTI